MSGENATQARRESPKIQSVEFALRILEFIAQGQTSVGVTELANGFGTTKSRIHRHLQTLVKSGYLMRDMRTERYRVSARLVALGHAVSETFEIGTAARDIARNLRDTLGNAVAISVPETDGNRIIMLVPSRSDIEIAVKPGSLLRLHASAQGKLSLAFGPASLLESVMTQDLASITPHTITDHSRLKTEIETVRKRGWASAPHEAMIGINALAAPVFGALGHYAGAIAITDSVQFISHKPSDQQVHELRTAAMDISRRLGFRGVRPV